MTLLNRPGAQAQPELPDESEAVFGLVKTEAPPARIKVVGIGGGGGNAAQRMAEDAIEHVELICVNTDAQALRGMKVERQVQIGREVTQGLGAGANPETGRQAAMESREALSGIVADTDMLFITAGMGGGTGTGAAPVIAEMAREAGMLTVAVVTTPFGFEGPRRKRVAEQGIEALREHVDSLITIPNDRLLSELGPDIEVEEAFRQADAVLHSAVRGISDLITRPGRINVDFADVKTVMGQQGLAMMGCGSAAGENRAQEATRQAISSRLLDDIEIIDARGMLVCITSDGSMTMGEFTTVAEVLGPLQASDATVVMGTAVDERAGDSLQVTIVAAGFAPDEAASAEPPRPELVNPAKVRDRVQEPKGAPEAPEPPQEAQAAQAAQVVTEGNLARSLKNPDWSDGDERGAFDIPAYLRHQHD